MNLPTSIPSKFALTELGRLVHGRIGSLQLSLDIGVYCLGLNVSF